jgi:hypothetical protein
VSDLVFVVGGFEEDRATRGLGEIPDGISRCASCLLAPVLMGHVLAMVPPTSETALYRALRLSLDVHISYVGASRPLGHPRASVRFVTQKARHIVCASCVYMCKLIVCKLIVPSLTSLMSITNFWSI